MNKKLLYIIGAVVLLSAGYFIFLSKPQAPQPVQEITEEVVSPSETVVVLSEQNNSGESGTATLVEENGQVKVTLNMTGAPEGVAQPAHIHMGACPDVGEVVYPLTSVMDGISETTLDVTLDQLRSELPLGINVHKSVSESGVYVSCGDLSL